MMLKKNLRTLAFGIAAGLALCAQGATPAGTRLIFTIKTDALRQAITAEERGLTPEQIEERVEANLARFQTRFFGEIAIHFVKQGFKKFGFEGPHLGSNYRTLTLFLDQPRTEIAATLRDLAKNPRLPAPLFLAAAIPPGNTDALTLTLAGDSAAAEVVRNQLALYAREGEFSVSANPGGTLGIRVNHEAKAPFGGSAARETLIAQLTRPALAEFCLVKADNEALVEALIKNPPEGFSAGNAILTGPCLVRESPLPIPPFDYFPTYSSPATGSENIIPIFLESETLATGRDLAKAAIGLNAEGNALIFTLTFRNPQALARIAAAGKGRSIAIVVNGVVATVAEIRPMTATTAKLIGNFQMTPARDLASSLNAATLPAPLTLVKEAQP